MKSTPEIQELEYKCNVCQELKIVKIKKEMTCVNCINHEMDRLFSKIGKKHESKWRKIRRIGYIYLLILPFYIFFYINYHSINDHIFLILFTIIVMNAFGIADYLVNKF